MEAKLFTSVADMTYVSWHAPWTETPDPDNDQQGCWRDQGELWNSVTLLRILSPATFGKGFDKAGFQLEKNVASDEQDKETEAYFT